MKQIVVNNSLQVQVLMTMKLTPAVTMTLTGVTMWRMKIVITQDMIMVRKLMPPVMMFQTVIMVKLVLLLNLLALMKKLRIIENLRVMKLKNFNKEHVRVM